MTETDDNSYSSKFNKTKSNEEIILGFQKLRNEQRHLFNRLSEFEWDLQEHRIVLDTLKDLHGDRKCFRMIGGILCERTIKDVLPVLKGNEEHLSKVVESYNQQLKAKEDEINKFKEEYNLKFKQADEVIHCNTSENKTQDTESSTANPSDVLVI